MSPRRKRPAGIRGRGAVFTYTWRDHTGRQYSRKAGDTLAEAEAFKRRVDDQLALGDYRPTSTTTFATLEALLAAHVAELALDAFADLDQPDPDARPGVDPVQGSDKGEGLGPPARPDRRSAMFGV